MLKLVVSCSPAAALQAHRCAYAGGSREAVVNKHSAPCCLLTMLVQTHDNYQTPTQKPHIQPFDPAAGARPLQMVNLTAAPMSRE